MSKRQEQARSVVIVRDQGFYVNNASKRHIWILCKLNETYSRLCGRNALTFVIEIVLTLDTVIFFNT